MGTSYSSSACSSSSCSRASSTCYTQTSEKAIDNYDLSYSAKITAPTELNWECPISFPLIENLPHDPQVVLVQAFLSLPRILRCRGQLVPAWLQRVVDLLLVRPGFAQALLLPVPRHTRTVLLQAQVSLKLLGRVDLAPPRN